MTGSRGGEAMGAESWAWYMTRLWLDDPAVADVVRRFVADEIPDRPVSIYLPDCVTDGM